jgi:hypothetical protein
MGCQSKVKRGNGSGSEYLTIQIFSLQKIKGSSKIISPSHFIPGRIPLVPGPNSIDFILFFDHKEVSMKVRIFGFDWRIDGGLPLANFYEFLEKSSGSDFMGKMIVLTHKGDYLVGVLLTPKNIKSFCKMQMEEGGFKITPQELERGTKMADFIFFVLYPGTGRGMYQHYHQSPNSNSFCTHCRMFYYKFADQIIESEFNEGKNGVTKSGLKDKYYGVFDFSTILKRESFIQCIRALSRVKYLSYELTTISERERAFLPASHLAKRATHRVFFEPEKKFATRIKREIIAALEQNPVKSATIHGFDSKDHEAYYKLIRDYAQFDEYDYDRMIQLVNIHSQRLMESVRDSPIIDILISVAERPDVRRILRAPVKK